MIQPHKRSQPGARFQRTSWGIEDAEGKANAELLLFLFEEVP